MAYTKYSLTPANNNAAPPNGAPEGMLPSAVNDTMRDMMAEIRDCGDGIRTGVYTLTAPVITGGSVTGSTINNAVIGGTTPTTGAFTTVTANKMADSQGGSVAPISSVMRNRIINGDMRIDQRALGTVTVNSSVYTTDRWQANQTAAGKYSVQNSTTAPTGFTNSYLATSLSAYSVSSSDIFFFQQNIEGNNISDFSWGTANAATVTLSFRVRSSLTGTFGGALANSDHTRSYPFTYTISVANTFEYKTIEIEGDTTGTWLTTNGIGIQVIFSLGGGASRSGTADAWAASTLYTATGATSVVGTNGATFFITGCQLEKGTQATGFEYRQIGTELALCQRYFVGFPANSIFFGYSFVSTVAVYTVPLSVTMRTTPTSSSVPANFDCRNGGNGGTTPSAVDLSTASNYILAISATSTGFTVGQGSRLACNSANALTLSAEL